MKALGIYGSPRKGGNTDLLLDQVLEGARGAGAEVNSIYARDLKITGCLECGGCDETGKCVVQDDMDKVYPLLEEANVVFLASPNFFYNVTAQVKLLIDRSQAMWSKRLLGKTPEQRRSYDGGKGYLICVGATKGKNLFQGVELTVKYFYDALDMSYEGGILFQNVEAKGEIITLPDAMEQSFNLGRSAVESMNLDSSP
ncbi:MAG: flavodoxin family protein [Deltaproteobacteria bacterium]|nr:MAG: flavodoxin family protein [Deltaproteobacteria bacterium]